MSTLDDGRLRVVQIACGSWSDRDGGGSHVLYALTEDGRVWRQRGDVWLDEPPVRDVPTTARPTRIHPPPHDAAEAERSER
jgi:hypothetical protein